MNYFVIFQKTNKQTNKHCNKQKQKQNKTKTKTKTKCDLENLHIVHSYATLSEVAERLKTTSLFTPDLLCPLYIKDVYQCPNCHGQNYM